MLLIGVMAVLEEEHRRVLSESETLDRLLSRMADGDKSALGEFYAKTKAVIFGYAVSILKNVHDAEDVMQDAYLNIYASAGNYSSTGKPMAYILTVVKNLCRMRFRAAAKFEDMPDEDLTTYFDHAVGLTTEDRVILKECLMTLTEEERTVVLLHALAGFKHREIASFTSLPLATVLSKYARAIAKLRKLLQNGDMAHE